jgi:hypothetical protein
MISQDSNALPGDVHVLVSYGSQFGNIRTFIRGQLMLRNTYNFKPDLPTES